MTKEHDWFTAPSPDAIQRPLVIDGCNIGRSASGYARTYVDCAGLVAVARWLLIKNFDVIVFLPVVYNNINNYNARKTELLHKLERLGIVTFTPARSGRGMRRAFINYDDLYVVSYASRHGGCILSGDKFKDILNQNCYSDFHNVILHRTINIRFRPLALDFVRFHDDLFYKHAPELTIFEHFHQKSNLIRHRLFVSPQQEGFQAAMMHRRRLSKERRDLICAELDAILYSMSVMEGKEFRTVDVLPIIDAAPNHHLLRIEDVFSSDFCREFYRIHSPIEGECDPLAPFVMEPIFDVDTVDQKTNRKKENQEDDCELTEDQEDSEDFEDTGETEDFENSVYPDDSEESPNSGADGNLEDLENHPNIIEGELIDLKNDEPSSEDEVECDSISESIIHPDLAEIEIRPTFPKDLSNSALLEWFTSTKM